MVASIKTVVDKAPHDWRLASFSRVNGVETSSYRCTRCGATRIEKTRTVTVCVEANE